MAEWEHHVGLHAVLSEAQRIGALGRAPIVEVIRHSLAFAAVLPPDTKACVDLGTGAGVPGLVIAIARPEVRVTLVDRRAKRTDALFRSVRALGIENRTEIICAEVDDMVADSRWQAQFDAAVSRGFGPPGSTLEAASRLVRSGGLIVISEPPTGSPSRWTSVMLERADVVSWERRDAVAMFHVEHRHAGESP
jgi:16S rRNA (guanine527-N7)-methyltransferase